ncbi:amino acid ABC transporter substrate-binding protein [Megasphaera vaginalis (ex Bordigoni et al. 2020)]|uniref:amino acid ABC transporter substrate-binding protein n=1 Tax=Megasphaera vaginalis (ex Bordigoni et al. 2020) TaxID=2045301 RepID=UPI000C7C2B10|nr:amino acid ABC transporter substrate-binding protein [Megasphaera vaginalis (ex Bordigoni et al. 2020)]
MRLKKMICAGLLTVAAVSLLTGCGGSGAKQAEQKLPDKLVIGLDDNFPPMGFRDDSGALVGFDIDLAKEASKRLGVEVEFKPIDWDSKEAALKSKQVDMLWNGLTITETRAQQIAFSKPYMKNSQLLVVRSDSPVTDRAGLAGKVIGTQEGSSSVDALDKVPDFKGSLADVKLYGDFVAAFMDLEVGRTDAILVDSVVGRYYMSKKEGKFKVIDDQMGNEEFGVGMRKEDTLLQEKMNDVLKQMGEDGTLTKLSQKWFGEDITIK